MAPFSAHLGVHKEITAALSIDEDGAVLASVIAGRYEGAGEDCRAIRSNDRIRVDLAEAEWVRRDLVVGLELVCAEAGSSALVDMSVGEQEKGRPFYERIHG